MNETPTKTRRASLREWLTNPGGLQRMMLGQLNYREQVHPGSMFRGTSDPKALARRRAKNKVARRSRRVNRIASKR